MDEFQTGELDELLSDARRLLGEASPARVLTAPDAPSSGSACATIAFTPVHAVPAAHPLPWEDPDFAGRYDGPSGATHVLSASARVRNRQAERFAVPEDGSGGGDGTRKAKRHRLRGFLLLLAGLLALSAALIALLARQPVNEQGLGARKDGFSTILLAGVDESGLRTDTLLLLSVDRAAKRASLVSVPRDTLVNGSYTVPKINGVYAVNGGGEEGIEMLLQRVGECIGFVPDGYALIGLDAFVELVDRMGGVVFDVPQDMYYDDPSQGLHIALAAGEQTLDGRQAMGLVRFRKGYDEADLRRVSVQRDFLHEAARQWIGPKLLLKAPALLEWVRENVETDLSPSNLSWLALSLIQAGGRVEAGGTLPGHAADIHGGSYYVLEPEAVATLVNQTVNPYRRKITAADLSIRA